MRIRSQIWIKATSRRVFRLAENITAWPALLPHYRWVRVFRDTVDGRTAEMAARRAFFPVKWTARQLLFAEEERITYRHIGGVTKGMEVEWRLSNRDGGTHVEVVHDLALCSRFVRSIPVRWIVAGFFVGGIAGRTLRHIKLAAESMEEATQ